MVWALSSQSVETLKTLRDQLGKLEGGSWEMGDFSDWFKSIRWDASMGFNTTELAPLGWAIETSLFEFHDSFAEYTIDDLNDAIDTVMRREGEESLDEILHQFHAAKSGSL